MKIKKHIIKIIVVVGLLLLLFLLYNYKTKEHFGGNLVKYDFEKINLDQFKKIITGKKPVIFTNVLKKQDLYKLEFSKFYEKLKNEKIRVRYGKYGTSKGRKNRRFRKEKIGIYCNKILNKDEAYGGNNSFKDLFKKFDLKPNCNFMSKFPEGNLWFGPKDSRTPLHKDGPRNLALQLYGKKKWTIYDSKDNNNLCYHKNSQYLEWSNYEINDFSTCIDAKKVKPYVIIIKPGEMLFLPTLWSHDVTNLTNSIMINFWGYTPPSN